MVIDRMTSSISAMPERVAAGATPQLSFLAARESVPIDRIKQPAATSATPPPTSRIPAPTSASSPRGKIRCQFWPEFISTSAANPIVGSIGAPIMTTSSKRSENHEFFERSIAGPPPVRQERSNTLIFY